MSLNRRHLGPFDKKQREQCLASQPLCLPFQQNWWLLYIDLWTDCARHNEGYNLLSAHLICRCRVVFVPLAPSLLAFSWKLIDLAVNASQRNSVLSFVSYRQLAHPQWMCHLQWSVGGWCIVLCTFLLWYSVCSGQNKNEASVRLLWLLSVLQKYFGLPAIGKNRYVESSLSKVSRYRFWFWYWDHD